VKIYRTGCTPGPAKAGTASTAWANMPATLIFGRPFRARPGGDAAHPWALLRAWIGRPFWGSRASTECGKLGGANG